MTDIRDEVAAALAVAGVDPATDTCTMDDHHGEPFADDFLVALAARGLTVVREGELDDDGEVDEQLEIDLAAYFEARRGAIVNVVAHKAAPPEYPGLALVPISDIERLETFLELPRNRAEYARQPEDQP